ncbi:MAG: heme-binding domain-containing protein [Planctomycetes bacterium]|nr:heme-binding domain-containing protein [Planctomycetota bacterium]
MNRFTKRLLVVLAVGGLAIQAVPVERTNPPVTAELVAPQPVHDLLVRACYDCHSHETVWPWYASVAPASWLVARDVEEGREHLDFSTFASLEPGRAAHALREIAEVLEEGEMPPWFYTPLHPDARLSADEVATLRAWAVEAAGGERVPGTAEHDDDR